MRRTDLELAILTLNTQLKSAYSSSSSPYLAVPHAAGPLSPVDVAHLLLSVHRCRGLRPNISKGGGRLCSFADGGEYEVVDEPENKHRAYREITWFSDITGLVVVRLHWY